MVKAGYLFIILWTIVSSSLFAQSRQKEANGDYLNLTWKQVAIKMPAEWYGSDEAKLVADNVLLSQKEIGGWAKNKPYHQVFTEEEKKQFVESKSEIGATFDNGATTMEMRFLARVYSKLKDERFKAAFIKGLDYIFVSQYDNGGWPQFFPFRKGNGVAYASNITFNDDAMINILKVLRDIVYDKEEYSSLQIDGSYKLKAEQALARGISCIIKTQIVKNGAPTVWCAQHDASTLAPANARKFELASFSGAESAGIALFLMTIRNPSKELIASVSSAVKWFETHKLEGIRLVKEKDKEGRSDLIVVEDSSASPVWARFYDLETEQPFFCDRDGIKKNTLAEIGYERRNGYSWYTTEPAKLLSDYSKWRQKLNLD